MLAKETFALLLGLAVQGVLATARAVFFEFQTSRIVATILLGRIIALFTIHARQGDDRTDIFLGSHCFLSNTRLIFLA